MWGPEPIGHRETVEGLWRARTKLRLPHALLFHGPAGIGKYLAARWFVQGLCCEHGPAAPCGDCGACKRLAAGSFADVFVLDPVELEVEAIQIGHITRRDQGPANPLEDFLALRPAEGGVRAVIVREFERANTAAQNALLKTLEEPGSDTILILESSRPDLLLETVRSRCVAVAFDPLSRSQASEVLAREGLVGAAAEACVRWSQGSPGRALQLEREGASEVLALLDPVLLGDLDPLLATPQLLAAGGEFSGKTPTAQGRSRVRAALDLVASVLRDALALRAGAQPQDLAHGEMAARMDWSDARLAEALRSVLSLRGEIELNLAPESILDRALLALREAGRESRRVSARR